MLLGTPYLIVAKYKYIVQMLLCVGVNTPMLKDSSYVTTTLQLCVQHVRVQCLCNKISLSVRVIQTPLNSLDLYSKYLSFHVGLR